MKKFSATAAISFGWNTFKQNAPFLVGLTMIEWVVNFGLGFVVRFTPGLKDSASFMLLLNIFTLVVSLVVSLGIIKIVLNLIDNGTKSFDPLFNQFDRIVNYFIASIVAGAIILVGLILLILPGIYFAIRLSFFPYYIVDKNLGSMDSLKSSWNATKGELSDLIVLGIFSIVIAIIGILLLGLGLLVAIPVTVVAYAYVYRRLSSVAATQTPVPAPVTQTPTPTQVVG